MSRAIFKKGFAAGKALLTLRRSLHWTQDEMAHALGVSQSSIQNWENGRSNPRARILRKYAELAAARGIPFHLQTADLGYAPNTERGYKAVGELRAEIERPLPENFWGDIRIRILGRRYSAETIVSAHAALDAILDNARSDIVERVLRDLDKFAGRFGEKKE